MRCGKSGGIGGNNSTGIGDSDASRHGGDVQESGNVVNSTWKRGADGETRRVKEWF